MRKIYRKYGRIVEITEVEKDPPEVRVYNPRERRTVYGARRFDNISRTRKICLWRVLTALEEFGSPLLVTLTFRGDASDASYANDSLRTFQVRLRNRFPKAQSLFIPELSIRGRIHFHGLLFNVPMSLGDTRKGRRIIHYGRERKDRTLAKLWGEGFVDATKTDGSPKLGYYISKYITKGSGHIIFNAMRLLRISHGFPRETVIRDQRVISKKEKILKKKNPIKKWEHESQFLGIIKKRTYLLDPSEKKILD